MMVVRLIVPLFLVVGSEVCESATAALKAVPLAVASATIVTFAVAPLARLPRAHQTGSVPAQDP
jgi:hypothetical protein